MQRSYGFTFIELAIVLLILGLLLAGLLGPLSARVEQEGRQKTQAMLEDIKEALYGFAVARDRLPCPDCKNDTGNCGSVLANDGVEDRVGPSCAITEGNLPWVTLGVPQFDAWGRTFAYRVRAEFADATDGAPCPPPPPPATEPPATAGVSFKLCSVGDIVIVDVDGKNIATDIPAIVLSYGSNGGAPPTSSFELQNWDRETPFVLKIFSREPTQEFDDLLVWISPKILANRMVTAGRLP